MILAETRVHALTWTRCKRFLIDELGADLAVCIGRKPGETFKGDPFYENSKFRWIYEEESEDFQRAFEDIGGANPSLCANLQKIKDQLFGGVVCSGHNGSAGILLFFRSFLARHLQHVKDLYDYIIVTRSDYYYELPHPPCLTGRIMIPSGEDYGGLTDRHMVCPSDKIIQALTILDPILEDGDAMVSAMSFHESWNLEKYISFMFDLRGLSQVVVRFPRVMYAVKEKSTKTRWSTGKFNREAQMIIKYNSEYEAVKIHKATLFAVSKLNQRVQTETRKVPMLNVIFCICILIFMFFLIFLNVRITQHM